MLTSVTFMALASSGGKPWAMIFMPARSSQRRTGFLLIKSAGSAMMAEPHTTPCFWNSGTKYLGASSWAMRTPASGLVGAMKGCSKTRDSGTPRPSFCT